MYLEVLAAFLCDDDGAPKLALRFFRRIIYFTEADINLIPSRIIDLSSVDSDGRHPLTNAIEKHRWDQVYLLSGLCADVYARDGSLDKMLQDDVHWDRIANARALIEYGANPASVKSLEDPDDKRDNAYKV